MNHKEYKLACEEAQGDADTMLGAANMRIRTLERILARIVDTTHACCPCNHPAFQEACATLSPLDGVAAAARAEYRANGLETLVGSEDDFVRMRLQEASANSAEDRCGAVCRMAVAAVNASGEPDVFFCRLWLSVEDRDAAEEFAKNYAEREGYEPAMVFDCERTSAGRALAQLAEWQTMPVMRFDAGSGRFIPVENTVQSSPESSAIVKTILMEDDAAPDARESFERELLKLTGNTISDFRIKGTKLHKEDDDFVGYRLGYYQLMYFADDPFYRLEKVLHD